MRFYLWVKQWFYSFADYVETKHEEKYSLAKLQRYINNARDAGKVSKQLIRFTEDYLKDFIADLASLSLRQYIDVYCGSVNANCFCFFAPFNSAISIQFTVVFFHHCGRCDGCW
jgi:hypothetical protein